jgi:hypothetical protein
VTDALVELVCDLLDSVAAPAGIRTAETLLDCDVEQQSQVWDEAARRQAIRGAHLRFGETAAYDLIRIRRQEKTIDENYRSLLERRPDLAGDQLGARGHEEKSFGSVR